jgi:hypothetical protein
MKVEKTNVHRLSVERECGCKAVREFSDPQYKEAIAEASYAPCKKHKAKPDLQEMMQMIMTEDVNREAENQTAAASHPRHPIPTATTTTLDGSSGETVTSIPISRPRPRVQVAPAGGGGAPASQSGPRRDPTQVRTINRDHNVGRRAAVTGRTPVTGVTVTNPAGPRRPNTVQVGEVELETPGMDILDMDGVAEDPRITRLAEDALLPDLEDDPTQA